MKIFQKNKREQWVSTNRVLVGNKKLTGRNPNFDTDETRLLISLWGDPKVQRALITTHKKHAVISRLADKMRDYGYQRSAEEINTRIKNLKCFYNRIKKDIDSNGNSNQVGPTWKHYSAMDEIMNRPIFSVRPDEVPKPSLRYKMEEAKREREERGETLDEIEETELMNALKNNQDSTSPALKLISLEEDNTIDDEDDDDDDNNEDEQNIYDDDMDYEPIPSNNTNNINKNNNNKSDDAKSSTSTVLTRSRNKNNDAPQHNDIQNINQNSIDVEESSIIKDEPIDVDDDSADGKPHVQAKESDSYPFSDYLRTSISNNQPSNKNQIITTVAVSLSSTKCATTSTKTNSPLKIGQATSLIGMPNNHSISNTQPKITPNTQAKISLVPTNFLLKAQPQISQQQDIQQQTNGQQQKTSQAIKSNSLQGLHINRQIPIRPKPSQHSQPRIIYTQHSAVSQQPNGIVNTNSGHMKVLLVNALQKNSPNVTPTATILQNQSVELQNNALYQSPTATLQTNINNIPQTGSVNLNGLVSSTSGDKIGILGSSSSNGKTPIGYRALLGQLIRTQEESNQINRERLQLERERLEYEKLAGDKFFKFFPDIVPNFFNLMHQQQQQQQQSSIPDPTSTQSIFVATPVVPSENSSNVLINNQTSENKDDPLILLTPKKEKEDD